MKRVLTFLILFFSLTIWAQAQVLNATVTVQYDHLPSEEQDDLETFGDKVEQYFNNYDWVDDDFEYDANCNIQIIIETVQKKTFEKIYKAQFVISSVSGETFYDKNWSFPYQESAPLSHNNAQFNPLTNFLDFYAYLVLAGELDTNGLLLGTPFYDKAMDIANRGSLSQYPQGWTQRIVELQKYTDMRSRPLREVKPDFFEALYLLDEEKPMQAYKEGLKVLEGMQRVYKALPNSKPLQMFFNSHYRELAKLFRGHNAELDRLIEMDAKHREAYRAVGE